ncbi:hypothetical protein AAZX31_06G238600 [Glycine max]
MSLLCVNGFIRTFISIQSGTATKLNKKRYKNKHRTEDIDLPTVLANVTKNFSTKNKLGEGGFGPVYKVTKKTSQTSVFLKIFLTMAEDNFQGTLIDGKALAVKRLSKKSGQGLDEFKNEVALIAKLQHCNLVKLLGFSVEGEEKMLIYEYMPNQSLNYFVFGWTPYNLF